MTQARIELVAAVAANGVIGRNGQLPWHLPDDLRHFKALTLDHPVIMGRRTLESIGRALPRRRSIVVSRTLVQPPFPGVELAHSLDAALELARNAGPVFIVGGGMLYKAALPRVQVMHLTLLDDPIEGDTLFPPFVKSEWRLTNEITHGRDGSHAIGFRYLTYERV